MRRIGAFGLTSLGATLVSDSEGSMRDLALMWMETHNAPFASLLTTVRSGECAASKHYGQPFFPWLSAQPEQIGGFSRAMADLTDGIKDGAIASYDFSDASMIVDVGAADGALLAKVLESPPTPPGSPSTLPHVMAEATAKMKSYGFGDRPSFRHGSCRP